MPIPVDIVKSGNTVTVAKRTVVQDVNRTVQVHNKYVSKRMVSVNSVVLTEYGVKICSNTCGVGCTGGLCNRTSGHCLGSLSLYYFGDMCNDLCSNNCVRPTNNLSLRFCHVDNGYCFHGCRAGWLGERCTEDCSKHCKDVTCFRSSDYCIYGCLRGYNGYRCEQGIV